MHDLTGFQRDVLWTIAGLGSPNGLSVKEKLDEYYAENINHPRVYHNLDSLADAKYIKKGQRDERPNQYTLSSVGRDVIVERREWEDSMGEEPP